MIRAKVYPVGGKDARAVDAALRRMQIAKLEADDAQRAAQDLLEEIGGRLVPHFDPKVWAFDVAGRYFHSRPPEAAPPKASCQRGR